MASTQAQCRKCHRPLRSPSPDGLGRACRARLRKLAAVMEQALAGLSPAQREKALALVSKVTETGQPGIYSVPGSGAQAAYVTTWASCTCPARVTCKHIGAVRAIAAVRASATRKAAA